jgi:uncharacterized membrane protein
MKATSQSLVFDWTPLSLTVAILFVGIVGWLAWMAWQRSGFRRVTGWLEGLRVLIAIGIALTLNQPEWREIFKPDSKPTLAVLVDVSRSMKTQDVFDPRNPTAEPTARAETAKPFLDAKSWSGLAQKMDVSIEPFSSDSRPPEEGTDLGGALSHAAQEHPHLRAVALVSDGDWNTGDPPSQAAIKLRMREVPVFTVPVGSESHLPDVELSSFDVPTFAVAGKPLRIPFTIESSLPQDAPATLQMKTSTGEVITKDVILPAMSRLQDVIVWKPENPGDIKLTLTVPKTGDERNLDNNMLEAPLSVRKEELHVLVIESFPRWEYRYLRNALERDPGVEANTLLFHPDLGKVGAGRGYLSAFPKDEELAKYDVIFLGDIGTDPGQLTLEQCNSLMKVVRDQATGLVFMPGFHGYEASLMQTPLGDLYPVVWDDAQPRGYGTSTPGGFVLTEAGERSLLTKLEDTDEASEEVWKDLPGFQWYAPALRAKAGTEVLAMHSTESNNFGRIPLIVTRTYGAGKILFMGTDGAWRWRKGVEDRYHYRFWGQVVRWMAYQRNMSQGDKMRLFYSPDRPRAGTVLTLNANAMSATGEPLQDGAVIAQITSPSGKISTVRLLPANEEAWGLFTGVFTPDEPGEYNVRLSSADAGTALNTTISVQGSAREKIGKPAKPEVLREIAQLTRGKFMPNADPASIAALIAALPQPELQERRVQLWAHPLWSGLLMLLLGIFWAGRKLVGAF